MTQVSSVKIPSVNIEPVSASEFFSIPNIKRLIDEYRIECANVAFGLAPPDREYYERLEAAGALFPAVMKDDKGNAVGFVVLLAVSLPHFKGKLMANVESIFLTKSHRKGTAGLRLIQWARKKAASLGAIGVYLSAPVDSRLETLASKIFKKTNSVFFIGV